MDDKDLYAFIHHRPNYVIHCIPQPNDVNRITSDGYIKKVFVEVNCAKNANELFLSSL